MSRAGDRRKTFKGTVAGLSGVTDFGFDVFRDAGGLTTHTHKGYEIVYMVSGQVLWQVEGEDVEVHGGELFTARPGEIHHGAGEIMHPCTLFWIVVVPTADGLGMPAEEAARLKKALKNGPRIVKASPDMENLLGKLLIELNNSSSLTAQKSLMQYALVEIGRAFESGNTPEGEEWPAEIIKAAAIIDQTLSNPLSVGELAEKVGFSASRLSELFRKHVGLPPGDFMLRRRIEAAQVKLKDTDESMTDIAYSLGFSSSQHFTDTFHKHTGVSPTAWRRKYRPRGGSISPHGGA